MKQFIFSESKTFRTEEIASYMKDCNRYKVLSDEEVVKLATDAQNGNRKAFDKLVGGNLKLVISIAKLYQGLGLELADLIAEGNIGLINAVNTFDVSRGTKIGSWIAYYVRKAIVDGLNDNGRLVRLPESVIRREGATKQHNLSMDAPLDSEEDGDKTFADTFASDMRTDASDNVAAMRHTITVLLGGLTDKEKEIVVKLFGIGCREHTMNELSMQYGCTCERIRQIKLEALEKMKECAKK